MSLNRSISPNYGTADDDELLLRLKMSDRDAFTAVYNRYYAMLYTFSLRYIKSTDDVQDILQTVFLKLWTARDVIFITSNLRSYLFAMTKNMVMNYIRDSNTALQHNYRMAQRQPVYDDDLYTYAERHHLVEMLQIAIRRLPPQQQTVAMMRCEGYSNREIAQRLNLSVNTINAHYRACMKTLKIYLGTYIKIITILLLWKM